MPKVVIEYDPELGVYDVFEVTDTWPTTESGYAVVVDMKSGTWKELLRNQKRWDRDQRILNSLFIEAQMAGRSIRER